MNETWFQFTKITHHSRCYIFLLGPNFRDSQLTPSTWFVFVNWTNKSENWDSTIVAMSAIWSYGKHDLWRKDRSVAVTNERAPRCNRRVSHFPSSHRSLRWFFYTKSSKWLEYKGKILIAVLKGIVGLFLRFVTPLTIAPAITMVGVSLFKPAAQVAGKHWGIAVGEVKNI